MILQCPNCGTKFQVNDNLIPSVGRKVKCSVCNNIWKTDRYSDKSSEIGVWIFWIITSLITFIILYTGLIIIYGNNIPIPNFLIEILTNLGIPIEGGNLFGRNFSR